MMDRISEPTRQADDMSLAATLGKELEAIRAEVSQRIRHALEDDAQIQFAAQWLTGLIDYFRGRTGHTTEWLSQVVEQMRMGSGTASTTLTVIQSLRRCTYECLRERLPGVRDTEMLLLLFQAEDHLFRIAVSLYEEADRKVAASERRLRKMMAESMSLPFVTVDNSGGIELVNSAFCRLAGVSEERLMGKAIFAYCDEPTAAELRRDLRQGRKLNDHDLEGTLLAAQNIITRVRFQIRPLFDEAGLRRGLALIVNETGNRQPVAQLNQAKMLGQLADLMGLAFVLVEIGSGKATEVNAAGERYVAPGDIVGKSLCGRTDIKPGIPCAECLNRSLTLPRPPFRIPLTPREQEGEPRWGEVVCWPVCNEQGVLSHVAKLVRDVTEQRMIEEQVLHQQKTSLMTQLAIAVAHQLRNPLSVMIGFAEMLSRGLPPDQVSTAVEKILGSGIRCKQVVENLLEFGASTRDATQPVHLSTLLRQRIMPAYVAQEKEIAWEFEGDPGAIECSPEQIVLVIQHLLDLALRSAESRVWVCLDGDGSSVTLRICHDGVPLPEDSKNRLFEPTAGAADPQGQGLVLSLSRRVVEDLGGRLYLDSGESNCIILQIPLGAGRKPELPVKETARVANRKRHVLLVEDEPDQSFLLVLALQSAGYDVDAVASAEDALGALERTPYDAAVIDILLGDGLGGRDIYAHLIKHSLALADHTMFITGDTMKYETRRFLQETKRPVLEKPFLITDFVTQLAHLVTGEAGG